MSWLIAVFVAEIRAAQNREQTPDFQISSQPALLYGSQGTQLWTGGTYLPSEVIKEFSRPANDNNKQLTMHETGNQNCLLIRMHKPGEIPVNKLFLFFEIIIIKKKKG